LFSTFGYHEIKTPVLEKTELFSRGIGQETDIVSKEMYSFKDVKGRGLTMRPEATASVVRAYVQHRLYQEYPIQKLYAMGPMFRHERPQKGRFRQFHQIDVELFGDAGPKSDAEMIILAMYLFETVGLTDVSLHINSLGCPDCRPNFKEQLKRYLADKTASLCADCQKRALVNPLRVFDCKVETKAYLNNVTIPFEENDQLVRGLDTLGGPDHPAIGFAVGVERLVALLEASKPMASRKPDLFIAALGENVSQLTFQWMTELRRLGIWVELDYGGKGLKSQMKKANRLGAQNVLIVGDNEAAEKKAVLRNMNTREQMDVAFDNLVLTLKELLQK